MVRAPENNQKSIKCVPKRNDQSKNHLTAHDVPKLEGVMKRDSTYFVIFSMAYGIVCNVENDDRSFCLGVTGKRDVDTVRKILWGVKEVFKHSLISTSRSLSFRSRPVTSRSCFSFVLEFFSIIFLLYDQAKGEVESVI